jgi:hypothetical protein
MKNTILSCALILVISASNSYGAGAAADIERIRALQKNHPDARIQETDTIKEARAKAILDSRRKFLEPYGITPESFYPGNYGDDLAALLSDEKEFKRKLVERLAGMYPKAGIDPEKDTVEEAEVKFMEPKKAAIEEKPIKEEKKEDSN